jgi:protein required for attachment to host cells
MNTTTEWIVVASRDQVRIFSQRLGNHPLELVTEIANPLGRLRLRDIESDKPGRATDNRMHARHAYSTEQDALTRSTDNFYRQVVELLTHGLEKEKYHSLCLIAEPRLLGSLRQLLTDNLIRVIKREIAKDLSYEKTGDIQSRISHSA